MMPQLFVSNDDAIVIVARLGPKGPRWKPPQAAGAPVASQDRGAPPLPPSCRPARCRRQHRPVAPSLKPACSSRPPLTLRAWHRKGSQLWFCFEFGGEDGSQGMPTTAWYHAAPAVGYPLPTALLRLGCHWVCNPLCLLAALTESPPLPPCCFAVPKRR